MLGAFRAALVARRQAAATSEAVARRNGNAAATIRAVARCEMLTDIIDCLDEATR